ncbi:hypothetical protein KDH_28280 [Dictyobacter sp. S3.2.2.5]|uniref:Uncharacterized protein n=1 Tax=Dictyobacter halimunensis TaxID=3026934 RepID=A0ABQ6FNY5_9CHLR|nr:hypothetical protein KDH_28280 [Dictyobacter sp. S3.2.2.5]
MCIMKDLPIIIDIFRRTNKAPHQYVYISPQGASSQQLQEWSQMNQYIAYPATTHNQETSNRIYTFMDYQPAPDQRWGFL